MSVDAPLLSVKNLTVSFRISGERVAAVEGVSFDLFPGQTFALVGNSGAGKSTVAKAVLRLLEPDAGSILFEGQELVGLSQRQLLPWRRKMQIVFQDPGSSLDPRMTVGALLEEPLDIHALEKGRERAARICATLEKVRLSPEVLGRFPHQLSGGQRQRVCLARALMLEPARLVADEPFSAIDASNRSQLAALFVELQRALGLSYLVVSHDLGLMESLASTVGVMSGGRMVELGPSAEVCRRPRHPASVALVAAGF